MKPNEVDMSSGDEGLRAKWAEFRPELQGMGLPRRTNMSRVDPCLQSVNEQVFHAGMSSSSSSTSDMDTGLTGGLAVVGAVSVGLLLMKMLWTCWCGFTTYFLSGVWRVDLKKYGRWAGTVLWLALFLFSGEYICIYIIYIIYIKV